MMKDALKEKVLQIIDKNSEITHVNMVTAYLNKDDTLEFYRKKLNLDIDVMNLVERNRWKTVKTFFELSYENKILQNKIFDFVTAKNSIKNFEASHIDIESMPKPLQDIIEHVQKNYTVKRKQTALFDIDSFNVS